MDSLCLVPVCEHGQETDGLFSLRYRPWNLISCSLLGPAEQPQIFAMSNAGHSENEKP